MSAMTDLERAEHIGATGLIDDAKGYLPGAVELRRTLHRYPEVGNHLPITQEQVSAAIRWCQSDEFWRSNILSMSKLRDKYEQLRLQASRGRRLTAVDAGRAADEILRQRAGADQLAVAR